MYNGINSGTDGSDYSPAYVPRNLRRLRMAAGYSIKDLAPKVGYSTSKLSRIENSKSQPTRATLERLALFFGVKVDDLYRSPYTDNDSAVVTVNNDTEESLYDRRMRRFELYAQRLNRKGWQTVLAVAEALAEHDRYIIIGYDEDEL